MKAIRLQHFRSLSDTGFVDLRPLTVLVGKNSSGKSSFLRFLPLIRQSVQALTAGPIQWYGDYVDFGGFEETLSSDSDDREIRCAFQFTLDPARPLTRIRDRRGGYRMHHLQLELATPLLCSITLAIGPDRKDSAVARLRSVSIEAAKHVVDIHIDNRFRLSRIVINGRQAFQDAYDQFVLIPGTLLPSIHRQHDKATASRRSFRYRFRRHLLALPELVHAIRPLFHGNTVDETVFTAAERIRFGTDDEILLSLRNLGVPGTTWPESVDRLHLSSLKFKEIRNLVVANHLDAIVRELDMQMLAFVSGVRYVKPVRATAERYYRPQDLAVAEIDAEGRNLASFLYSLTDAERRDFEAWMTEELRWGIVTRLRGGHLSVRICELDLNGPRQEESSVPDYNLADVGFGFSQILPIVVQLWSMQRKEGRGRGQENDQLIFAIEQPELLRTHDRT